MESVYRAMTRAARGRPGWAASRSSTPNGLPEGNRVRAECAGEPQQDRHEDRLRLALCERRGLALRRAPPHGRGEGEGEVRERGDYACALELVRRADEKVGYQERGIVARALYDERKDDTGELDEEVDGMSLCGRIEHDGEEVDESTEDMVGDCDAGLVWVGFEGLSRPG